MHIKQIVRALRGGVTLSVHVQPGASRTEAVGIHGHALKIRVAAAPADGAANDELRRFLARRCDVPFTAIQILSGKGSREKRVFVNGRTVAQARDLFQLPAEADR